MRSSTNSSETSQQASGTYKPRSLNIQTGDREKKQVDRVKQVKTQSSEDITPVSKSVVKPVTVKPATATSGVPSGGFSCTMCGNDHKFSPFNVTVKCWERLPDLIPMMVVDEKSSHYTVCAVRNHTSKGYRRLDIATIDEIIVRNPIDNLSGCAIYWTDGIEILGTEGLIKMLVMKPNLVTRSTIEGLVKMIYCPQWWELFLQKTVETVMSLESYADSILRARSYFELIIEYATASGKIVKDHGFTAYEACLRKCAERQKRINEEKQYRDSEAVKKSKEEDGKRQLEESLEALRLREIAEIEDDDEVVPIMSFEDRFLASITTERKGGSCKFLATINPDPSVFANIVLKAGEASKLQSGVDSEDRLRKIAVWEYYKNQEDEIKKGIKYKDYEKGKKKSDTVIPDIPKHADPKKPKPMIVLTSTQKLQYEKIWKDHQSSIKSGKQTGAGSFVLDPWQRTATDYIRQNMSCLITGPTSGGKTYVMMKGMDNIINGDENQIVVYVSPTFHLAYQTYANTKATFPKRSVAMITAELVSIPTNTNIIIGTAPELLNYFVQTKKTFQVGIFDEIHVALSVYYEQSSKSEVIRARAYKRLIAKCEKQLIAASATIGNPELLQKFIADKMSSERKDGKMFKSEDIKLVQYTDRVIPLNEYRFIDNSTIQPLIRDTTGSETSETSRTYETLEREPDINSANLFKLLVNMRRREMTPGIVFESTDDIAWRTYVDLINYVESLESVDYSQYTRMIEKLNDTIDKFNIDRNSRMDSLPDNDQDDSRRREGEKGNGRREAGLNSIRSSRIKTYRSMISDAKTILSRDINKYNVEEYVSECNIPLEILNELNIIPKIAVLFNSSSEELLETFPNLRITKAHIDMMQIIRRLEDVEHDHTDNIPNIILDKGSFYRFANSCGMEQLKAIREPGSDENSWKLRRTMITLAEAQHINPKDIDGIIDVIMRGLEFGIAIINPSLPFVIQNIILENLRTKNMGVVIASESMSMGINYPLRSVVIKSSTRTSSELNIAKMIQMAGRCGRRGKDDQAHVIYWGVTNANRANSAFIPQLTADSDDFLLTDGTSVEAGSMIDNQLDLAVKIGLVFNTFYFYEERKKAVLPASATKSGGRIKESRHGNDHFESFVPVENDEDRERKICEARSRKRTLSRSQYIKPTINMLAIRIGYSEEEAEAIAEMVCKIDNDIISESYSINSFQKSRDINLIMHMLIELHNTFVMSANTDFLSYLEEMVTILQIVEYRLVKLAN